MEIFAKIGDSNYIMAYVHIAHDVLIGHNNSIVNATQIAGHVEIGNNAVIGGMSGIHQFCKIGDMAMIAMQSRINMDVAPYILVDGNPSKLIGLNTVGLKRNGLTPLDRRTLQKMYRLFFRSGVNTRQAISIVEEEIGDNIFVQNFIAFVKRSQRGLTR